MSFRILTQINFSSGGNPEGDSGLYFTGDLLLSILEQEENFHFYVMVPAKYQDLWRGRLNHPRITLLPIDIETRSHGGAFQFNPRQILNVIKFRRYEIDCLFINQPEATNAYIHLFNKLLYHDIPTVSYVHWFDTRSVKSKHEIHDPVILSAVNGMISSSIVGCNSAYGRQMIIEQSKKWFNNECIHELENKIRILPPGINTSELDQLKTVRNPNGIKRIIVNHRLLKYTGVRDLLTQTLPKLWKIRQDFEVVITNPSKVRLPLKLTNVSWLTNGKFERKEYIRQLWQADIVLAPHRATHWSISTIEAIYTGCVPLMNDKTFFPELMAPILNELDQETREHVQSNWFYSGGSLIKRICFLLDNVGKERDISKKISPLVKSSYDWHKISLDWIEIFHDLDAKGNAISETNPSLLKILNMIKKDKRKSKEDILRELAWGPQSSNLSWSAYRNRLKTIVFDDSRNPDVIYEFVHNDRK